MPTCLTSATTQPITLCSTSPKRRYKLYCIYTLYDQLKKFCGFQVLAKMKDETAGKPIKEFFGLCSKMYSLLVNGKEKKTAKGIQKSDLCHAAYRDVLLNEAVTRATMNLIRSHHHKLVLSSFDDKRYVLDDKVHTRAHGHYLNHLERVMEDE